MGLLEGRVALVTGGSRGLGAAIARRYAAEGAAVGVNYVNRKDKADELVGEIRDAGGTAMAVQADVTDEGDVERMVEETVAAFGDIRVLVNNAGVLSTMAIDKMPVEEWDRMMASHLRSHFLVSKHVIPSMRRLKPIGDERRVAKIINMSSGIGQKGGAGGAGIVHYVTAKAGVLGFTKGLAGELAPDITVNGISPGTHPTDILGDLTDEWIEEKSKVFLLGFGTVEDVAETALFLASPATDYYTGQVLTPNGGDVMNA